MRTKEQALNIHEVARRARVSTATVSRAINRVPTVNPKLAQRVWNAIKELGYYPNTQARALVSGRSRIFGLIVSELTNPFFPEIVQVFETIAVRHHYEILLTSTMNDPEQMESSVRRMIERQVEGVAVMTFGMEEALLEDLKLRQVPLVFVDVGPHRPRVSNLRVDNERNRTGPGYGPDRRREPHHGRRPAGLWAIVGSSQETDRNSLFK